VAGFTFTDGVRAALARGREEATRLQHEYVGTEHILLGLVHQREEVAAIVLRNLGVDLDQLQRQVEEAAKTGKAARTTGPDLPYTPRARKVLELAMSEARELDSRQVGTEHLLLGLLREERGLAVAVLVGAGVTLDAARAEIARVGGVASSPHVGMEAGARDVASFRLGPRAREVVRRALDETVERGHAEVGTAHLLLGALAEPDGMAAVLVDRLGIDRAALRDAIGAGFGDTALAGVDCEHPLTQAAIVTLDAATAEASGDGRPLVATHHLLFALLEHLAPAAAESCERAGLTTRAAKAEYERIRE
jgi:ATP-dependent Clp protease ATP-binding subunit ClpA